MAVYQSMQELIGNTPLVRLTHLGFPKDVYVFDFVINFGQVLA